MSPTPPTTERAAFEAKLDAMLGQAPCHPAARAAFLAERAALASAPPTTPTVNAQASEASAPGAPVAMDVSDAGCDAPGREE